MSESYTKVGFRPSNKRAEVKLDLQLKHLGNLIFGPEIMDELKSKRIDGVRGIYELTGATIQCTSVLKISREKAHNKPCYICGMNINNTDNKIAESSHSKRKIKVNLGLTAECEHLLSISQAIMLLGLYSPASSTFKYSADPKEFQLEYKWAHRTCNQIKSDISFIKISEGAEKFLVDTKNVETLLINIFNNQRTDSVNFRKLLKKMYKTQNDFVNDRRNALIKPFQDICDYLNRQNYPGLVMLYGAVKALEGPMNPEAKKLLEKKFNTPIKTHSAEILSVHESFEALNNDNMSMKMNKASLSNLLRADIIIDAKNEIKDLLEPAIGASLESDIETIHKNSYGKLSNAIKYHPKGLDEDGKNYVKWRLLDYLANYLENNPKEDKKLLYPAIEETKKIFQTTSELSNDSIEAFKLAEDGPLTTIGSDYSPINSTTIKAKKARKSVKKAKEPRKKAKSTHKNIKEITKRSQPKSLKSKIKEYIFRPTKEEKAIEMAKQRRAEALAKKREQTMKKTGMSMNTNGGRRKTRKNKN